MVHRDIKPQNIIMTKKGSLKIGDFGLSRVLGNTTLRIGTVNGGTAFYVAPEVLEAQKHSFKVDVWAVGVIIYEMCEN